MADDNHLYPSAVSASDDINCTEDHTGADFKFTVLQLLLKVDVYLI